MGTSRFPAIGGRHFGLFSGITLLVLCLSHTFEFVTLKAAALTQERDSLTAENGQR